jgi:hypothetical protein
MDSITLNDCINKQRQEHNNLATMWRTKLKEPMSDPRAKLKVSMSDPKATSL